MAMPRNTNKVPELVNWQTLNDHLRTLTIPGDAWKLLLAERKGKRRSVYINRIYGRFTVLREAVERKELGLVG